MWPQPISPTTGAGTASPGCEWRGRTARVYGRWPRFTANLRAAVGIEANEMSSLPILRSSGLVLTPTPALNEPLTEDTPGGASAFFRGRLAPLLRVRPIARSSRL